MWYCLRSNKAFGLVLMMEAPQIPDNEQQRLDTLSSLKVLDTGSEERFDRITRLARRLFDVPIALVSLVDENRQWFKSCYGLDTRETGRDISFCGHAILGDEPFIVEDASKDSRFWDNPLVVGDPNIRFYTGVPLVHEDGMKLGTLCIIDSRPRHLDSDALHDLIDLAKMAEMELSLTHHASMDDLTNISNRRGFMRLATKSVNHCQYGSIPYSLAYFDLNGFKAINDQHGHSAGDELLKQFANILKTSFRDSDVITRLGGDEFAVLMSGAAQTVAHIAVQRLEKAVEAFNQTSSLPYRLCFSFGVASSSVQKHLSLMQLLEEADKKMYQHKRERKAKLANQD